jgi:hypothetical protein
MEFKKTQEALKTFAETVVKESKKIARQKFKNTTGNLEGSIGYVLNVYENSFNLEFTLAADKDGVPYGSFVDLGVRGSKSNYPANRNSPYKFSGNKKSIPPQSLDKWLVRKKLAPRDNQGRFIDRRSIKFLIARSIYEKGIEARKYFTKPFEDNFNKLPNDVVDAFGLDIDEFFELTT